jgi:hypothetical protein
MIGRPSRRLGVCENYCGTVEIQSPARLGLEENTAQDAEKGHTSHPPKPGAPRRAIPRARPQRAKRRRRTLRYVELLSEARTPLVDFFNILLVVTPLFPAFPGV